MQVGSSSTLTSQMQTLENAALGKYQDSQDFSFLLQTDQSGNLDSSSGSSDSGSSGSSSSGSTDTGTDTSTGYQMSGSFTGGSIYAVGTMNANGQMTPFSQQQIQSEQDAIQTQRKAAYSDALQNFMTLSQASGQLANTTMNDQVQFTGDNGLIGGSFDTSLSLKTVGGSVPSA